MKTHFLNADNYPGQSQQETDKLQEQLDTIVNDDCETDIFSLLSGYKRILADNSMRSRWETIYPKLDVLFKCGSYAPLDGPMFGVTMNLRDSDLLKDVAAGCGKDRSALAQLEVLASSWNATFAQSTLWTGKTFESIKKDTLKDVLENRDKAFTKYNNEATRVGRNFFRHPIDPNPLEAAGLPLLSVLWNLKDRPVSTNEKGFLSTLSLKHLESEKVIPYQKTGGYFLATGSRSVLSILNGKNVYQLDYRWGALRARFPMTNLIDELVKIDEGIYLGQLVLATKNFSVGTVEIPLPGDKSKIFSFGREYDPFDDREGLVEKIIETFTGDNDEAVDYGYQHNGYFLMLEPAFADRIFAEDAFPELQPVDGR